MAAQTTFRVTSRSRFSGSLILMHYERTTAMPLIKKAPPMVSLEVMLEEPVKQLLEDYAKFIDSTPDHVVNTVIKKNLWRDQEYRNWREQHRSGAPHAAQTQKA